MSKRKGKRKGPPPDAGQGPRSSPSVQPRRRFGRSWRAKLILAFVSLAAALLLGEVIVRVTGTAPEVIPIGVTSEENVYRRSTNPILSFEFKPGYRSDDPNVPVHYRRINSHGFRDVEREYAKPPGTKRVILLGDSVVVGYGCGQIDQLMSRQLEALYDTAGVEVLNLAVTGYCTRAEVELLKERGLAYDPDLVVLVFVENDFRNFNPEGVGADGITHRPAVVRSLFQSSQMFRLACLELNWFGFGLEADPERWNQHAIGENNVVDGLQLLRELADEHGFEVVVAVWPGFTNNDIEYPDKMFMPGSRDLIVGKLARANGLDVVGLREAFRDHWQAQSPRPNPRLHYTIGDEMHPSPLGHRVAAEILHEFIEGQGLLKGASRPPQLAASAPQPNSSAAIEAARDLGTDSPEYGLVHLNEAEELRQKGDLDDAAALLVEVIASDSLFANDARVRLAVILGEQGKLAEARKHLQAVLDEKPDHAQALAAMGVAESQAGDFEEAIAHMRRAVELRPEMAHIQFMLGSTLANQERWSEARGHLRLAAKLTPNNAQAISAWGIALAHEGRYGEAAEQFRHALQLDPTNEEFRRYLSTAESHIHD